MYVVKNLPAITYLERTEWAEGITEYLLPVSSSLLKRSIFSDYLALKPVYLSFINDTHHLLHAKLLTCIISLDLLTQPFLVLLFLGSL